MKTSSLPVAEQLREREVSDLTVVTRGRGVVMLALTERERERERERVHYKWLNMGRSMWQELQTKCHRYDQNAEK